MKVHFFTVATLLVIFSFLADETNCLKLDMNRSKKVTFSKRKTGKIESMGAVFGMLGNFFKRLMGVGRKPPPAYIEQGGLDINLKFYNKHEQDHAENFCPSVEMMNEGSDGWLGGLQGMD